MYQMRLKIKRKAGSIILHLSYYYFIFCD